MRYILPRSSFPSCLFSLVQDLSNLSTQLQLLSLIESKNLILNEFLTKHLIN